VIPEETIAEIRERTDILAVVGEYVRLKKRGTNHTGLCPFHNEKTPSFNVNPARGFYHCFGCQASGDVIRFLMQIEGISFPEATRNLAERAGVALPETVSVAEDAAVRRARQEKERLVAVMGAALEFFEESLRTHPSAEVARAELEHREIQTDTAQAFRLGYAPPSWDALCTYLEARGHALRDACTLGLVGKRRSGTGYYDRFRSRLQFPVYDVQGQVVAFSGRLLAQPASAANGTSGASGRDFKEPKYINSPEGPLYRKGALLFGLHQARVALRRTGWAILCEGNFDLLALHQAGFANVVAPLGTAFTAAQAKLMARYAERVTLIFDGDAAGAKATATAYPLLREANLTGRVAMLPTGEDPDSFVRSRGTEALQGLLDRAPGIVEYLIDRQAEACAGEAASERVAGIQALAPILVQVKNPIEIGIYIDRVAQKFEIPDVHAVKKQLRQGLRAKNHTLVSGKTQSEVAQPSQRVKLPPLEADAVGLLIDQPSLLVSEDAKKLEELLTSPELRGMFRSAGELVQENGKLDLPALLSRERDNHAISQLRERFAVSKYPDKGDAQLALRAMVARLQTEKIHEERARLLRQITEARRSGDDALANHLTKQRDALGVSASKLADGKR